MKNDPFPADIAEMMVRGYDRSTIAEAVRLVIETAFAKVKLGDGISPEYSRCPCQQLG